MADVSEAAKLEKERALEAEKREERIKAAAREKLGEFLVEMVREKKADHLFHWSTPIEKLLTLRKAMNESGNIDLAQEVHALIMSRVKE